MRYYYFDCFVSNDLSYDESLTPPEIIPDFLINSHHIH